jgi:hypothetical protein
MFTRPRSRSSEAGGRDDAGEPPDRLRIHRHQGLDLDRRQLATAPPELAEKSGGVREKAPPEPLVESHARTKA